MTCGGSFLLWRRPRHAAGLSPADVEAILLSHPHRDDTGGLRTFLRRHFNLTVYVPRSFPRAFLRRTEATGASVQLVGGPQRLVDGIYPPGRWAAN